MRPFQRRSAPTIRTCCGASKPSPNFRRSGLDATQRLARLDRLVAKRELRRDGLNDASAYRVASPSASSGEWTSMAPPPERLVTFSRLHGERVWRRIGERDGWAIWASECVVCGGPVQITTLLGLRAIGSSRAFWTVTCPAHRLTKTESGKNCDSPPPGVGSSRRSSEPSSRSDRRPSGAPLRPGKWPSGRSGREPSFPWARPRGRFTLPSARRFTSDFILIQSLALHKGSAWSGRPSRRLGAKLAPR